MKNWLIKLVALFLLLPFASLSLAAQVTYYDTNNVGTPVAMWDAGARKVWETEYYPFGKEYQTSPAVKDNSRKFIGKEKDKETDLTYFGARYYDDLSGRFLAPDPVRPVDALTSKTNQEILDNPQRLNRYAYGLNNPYRYVDPDGEWAEAVFIEGPSIAVGVHSFVSNVKQGNVGSAIVDAVGVVADTAAAVAPGIPGGVGLGIKASRSGKLSKLQNLASDSKVSSADRGWITQETNAIKRKSINQSGNVKKHIRNPPGKDLAHERGREAAKGFGYDHSNLQNIDLHKLQHKHDNFGRKNKIRN